MRAAGSAVYIIRYYNSVNQLYKSGRSLDLSSNTCLCKRLIRCYFTVLLRISARVLKEIRAGTSVRKSRGICEYFCKPSFFRLAREKMFVLACGTPINCRPFKRLCLSRVGSLSYRWNRFLCLCRRPCVQIFPVLTPVLEGFDVVVLRAVTTAVRGSRVFAVGFEAVGFDFSVALCLRSICAGLTQSSCFELLILEHVFLLRVARGA